MISINLSRMMLMDSFLSIFIDINFSNFQLNYYSFHGIKSNFKLLIQLKIFTFFKLYLCIQLYSSHVNLMNSILNFINKIQQQNKKNLILFVQIDFLFVFSLTFRLAIQRTNKLKLKKYSI